MPLLIVVGLPASGKSTRSREVEQFVCGKDKKVVLISENEVIPKTGHTKNDVFFDSQKEKIIRAELKSDVMRILNKEDLVILDAGNYIKGYRYELYCASKAARVSQSTLFCGIPQSQAESFNQNRQPISRSDNHPANDSDIPYTKEIFDALCLRFEEPHGNSRWDCPLFTVFPGDQLDLESLYGTLFEKKPPPPNLSTQNPPLNATNYLFQLDKVTQEITNTVLAARKIGHQGPVIIKGKTPNENLTVSVPGDMNASQLNRVRRQFLNYSKINSASGNLERAPQLFVQFLNSSFNK